MGTRTTLALGLALALAGAAPSQASRLDDPALLRAWRQQVDKEVHANGQGLLLVVVKKAHRLDCYRTGRLTQTFPVDLGGDPVSRKLHEDRRTTPEGLYRVCRKLGPGETSFTLALLLDYPNDEDRRRFKAARARGDVPPACGIGGAIEIHGYGGRGEDWTWGCIAVSDEAIRWLFSQAAVGTQVLIVGNDRE